MSSSGFFVAKDFLKVVKPRATSDGVRLPHKRVDGDLWGRCRCLTRQSLLPGHERQLSEGMPTSDRLTDQDVE
jgi:hypothetical protein